MESEVLKTPNGTTIAEFLRRARTVKDEPIMANGTSTDLVPHL